MGTRFGYECSHFYVMDGLHNSMHQEYCHHGWWGVGGVAQLRSKEGVPPSWALKFQKLPCGCPQFCAFGILPSLG